jgi:hypothetical protein
MIPQAFFYKPTTDDFEASHWGVVVRRRGGVVEHIGGQTYDADGNAQLLIPEGAVVPEGEGFWLVPQKYLTEFEAAWLAKYPPAGEGE